jgi:hypothetical protein
MKETFLNIALLADQPLRFAYGLSVSHGKDGNRLLARLGAIFQQEYLVRQGKLAIIDKKRRTVPLNFSNWERDDLEEGFILFASLTETFKKMAATSRV